MTRDSGKSASDGKTSEPSSATFSGRSEKSKPSDNRSATLNGPPPRRRLRSLAASLPTVRIARVMPKPPKVFRASLGRIIMQGPKPGNGGRPTATP